MSLAHARRVGESVESLAVDQIEPLRPVHDDAVQWYDCTTLDDITARTDPEVPVAVAHRTFVARGAEIELKSARVSTSNGSRRSAGRWYFRKRQHDRLVGSGAWYALAVYDQADRDGETERWLLTVVFVPARVVGGLLDGRWHDSRSADGQVCKLSWPRVVSLDLRAGGGRTEP